MTSRSTTVPAKDRLDAPVAEDGSTGQTRGWLGTEADVAEKTIVQKLQIKPGSAVWLSDASKQPLVEPLPDGVRRVGTLEDSTATILFAEDRASLEELLAESGAERLAGTDLLWVAYPKGGRADINRDSVWPMLAELGLRPVSQISLDDVWSALRFRPLKPGEAPFTGGR